MTKINIKLQLFRQVKTPTLLQTKAVECGATALGIILSYYGRIVPLTELGQECSVFHDGIKVSSLSSITQAARRYGMEARGVKAGFDGLQRCKPPYIVFWNFNHFLVVEGFSKERVYLNDPATGRRSVSLQEFDKAYTGFALLLETGKEFKKSPSLIFGLGQHNQISLSLKSQLIYFLPEECVAELQALRQQLKFEQRSNWIICMIMLKNILELFWAFYVQIKIDNLWLLQHRGRQNIDK